MENNTIIIVTQLEAGFVSQCDQQILLFYKMPTPALQPNLT